MIIATGRSFDGSLPVHQKLQLHRYDSPIVCLNGAMIFDVQQKKMLKIFFLKWNLLKQILLLDGVDKIFIDYQMRHFSCQKGVFVKQFIRSYDQQIQFIPETELIKKKIISGFILGNSLEEVNQKVSQIKDQEVNFASSFDNATQFSNSSKYQGIKQLALNWKINHDEIMTIGDNLNDLDMIAKVKYGIAVGNAKTELKQVAYDVTAPWDQDGVAKAIEKHFYNL